MENEGRKKRKGMKERRKEKRTKKVAEEIEIRGDRLGKEQAKEKMKRQKERERKDKIKRRRKRAERGRDRTMYVAKHCEGGRILTPARSVRFGTLLRNSHRLNELYSTRVKFGMHARSFREEEIGEFLEKLSHTLNRTSSAIVRLHK